MPTPSPDAPRDLTVEHDLGGLRYRVAAWEGALLRLIAAYAVLLGAEIAVLLLAGAVLDQIAPGLAELVLLFVQVFLTMLFMMPAPIAIWWVHRRVVVDVRIDQNAMHLARRAGSEQVTWAACADVRRRGRIVEVLLGEQWRTLPSPNAYTDAAWLEGLIREQIDARRGDALAPPEEVAAALRALGAKSQERAR